MKFRVMKIFLSSFLVLRLYEAANISQNWEVESCVVCDSVTLKYDKFLFLQKLLKRIKSGFGFSSRIICSSIINNFCDYNTYVSRDMAVTESHIFCDGITFIKWFRHRKEMKSNQHYTCSSMMHPFLHPVFRTWLKRQLNGRESAEHEFGESEAFTWSIKLVGKDVRQMLNCICQKISSTLWISMH